MKIGLFGGTFNPPHIGHLRAAKIFCEQADLDILYVVPAFVSPFKTDCVQSVTALDRFQMTSLCFKTLKDVKTKIIVSDIEIKNNRTSYTIDTVNTILKLHGENKIYMLMGSDMFCSLEKWKSHDELFAKCHIYTLARAYNEKQCLTEYKIKYENAYAASCVICTCPALVVSSTDIRTALQHENYTNLQNLLTSGVLRYIIENSLFTDTGLSNDILPTSKDTLEQIQKDMPMFLSQKRSNHTLGVCEQALEISDMLFDNLGIDKSYLSDIKAAALLHDFTKELDLISQKELCLKYCIDTDEVNGDSCNLLHSKTAAHLAKSRYNINENVFNAVYNHTTGRENMSVFEKIIFISDYLEPGRTQDVCQSARKALYNDIANYGCTLQVIDKAVLGCLNSTIQYLLSISQPIDIQTIKARNYLISL